MFRGHGDLPKATLTFVYKLTDGNARVAQREYIERLCKNRMFQTFDSDKNLYWTSGHV